MAPPRALQTSWRGYTAGPPDITGGDEFILARAVRGDLRALGLAFVTECPSGSFPLSSWEQSLTQVTLVGPLRPSQALGALAAQRLTTG